MISSDRWCYCKTVRSKYRNTKHLINKMQTRNQIIKEKKRLQELRELQKDTENKIAELEEYEKKPKITFSCGDRYNITFLNPLVLDEHVLPTDLEFSIGELVIKTHKYAVAKVSPKLLKQVSANPKISLDESLWNAAILVQLLKGTCSWKDHQNCPDIYLQTIQYWLDTNAVEFIVQSIECYFYEKRYKKNNSGDWDYPQGYDDWRKAFRTYKIHYTEHENTWLSSPY